MSKALPTKESRLKGQEFKPQSTDLLVIGSIKCGTTWMQQIIHQLRTGGDMDFADVMEVVPLLQWAQDTKQDLYADQKSFPRCFKANYWYPSCPKGARYIWCLREPCAVAYSHFKMFSGWFLQPGVVAMEDYVRHIWLAQGEPQSRSDVASYFHHLASWWPHRNDPNVLLVFYEDLKEDYESTVRSVAEFMDVTDEHNIQTALERSTFEYMKIHSDKFNMGLLRPSINARLGLPENTGFDQSKIRAGTTTEGPRILPTDIRNEIQKKWEAVVAPVTGCSTYEELRIAWKKEKSTSTELADKHDVLSTK